MRHSRILHMSTQFRLIVLMLIDTWALDAWTLEKCSPWTREMHIRPLIPRDMCARLVIIRSMRILTPCALGTCACCTFSLGSYVLDTCALVSFVSCGLMQHRCARLMYALQKHNLCGRCALGTCSLNSCPFSTGILYTFALGPGALCLRELDAH